MQIVNPFKQLFRADLINQLNDAFIVLDERITKGLIEAINENPSEDHYHTKIGFGDPCSLFWKGKPPTDQRDREFFVGLFNEWLINNRVYRVEFHQEMTTHPDPNKHNMIHVHKILATLNREDAMK